MSIEDKDFIERQMALAAKGLHKLIDILELEKLFSKQEDLEQGTENSKSEKDS